MALTPRPPGLHRHPRPRARARSAARCCRRRTASGACRPRCCRRCRATAPTSRRTAPRRARSWRSSATGRTSGSRSRCRRATSRPTATRRSILIDQLKRDLYRRRARARSTPRNWFPEASCARITRSPSRSAPAALDDPDQKFYENYVCGAERNYTGYCNPEIDKLIDEQSMEADQEKRKQLVWEIERRLAEDAARPVLLYPRLAHLLAARASRG